MKSLFLAFLSVLAFNVSAAYVTLPGGGPGAVLTSERDPVYASEKGGLMLTNSPLLASKVASNDLASTALGAEGIRRVGALGGYTLEEFIEDTATRGPARDLPQFVYQVYPSNNLNVSYSGGDIYEPTYGYVKLNSGSYPLPSNGVSYAYWRTNNPSVISWAGQRPQASSGIYLGTFVTAFGAIIHAGTAIAIGDALVSEDVAFANIFPSLVTAGLSVYANGTGLTNVVLDTGVEYHNMADRIVHSGLDLAVSNRLTAYYHDAAGRWASHTTNLLPVGMWDTGSNLVACSADKWYRGLFVSRADSGGFDWVMPDQEYTNDTTALVGADPDVPTSFVPYVPKCTAYVFKGDDVVLRTSSTYWVDRRNSDNLLKGSTVASSGSANTPTLSQVLAAGAQCGNKLPTGLGLPTEGTDATSKDYVDSTINNIHSGKAYVDMAGDDAKAMLESSILPFRNIQTAINQAAAAANTSNRYLVVIGNGQYNEAIVMRNNVALRGDDVSTVVIHGSITYPPQYTDLVGSEVALLTVRATNQPAVVFNAGSDNAYMGLRSCYLISDYTDVLATNKTVMLVQRGLGEAYATTYYELNNLTTNAGVCNAFVFEHTTDPQNPGLSQFTSFSASSLINCTDTNDDVGMMYSHDNTDAKCINQFIGGLFNMHLDESGMTPNNAIKLVKHDRAQGRTLSMGNATRLFMATTNNCTLMMAYAKDGTADNVAILRNNNIQVVSGSSSNIWFGAAVTTNDNIRIYDTEVIQANAFNYYPRKYTADGSLGGYYINTPHQAGDQILGGALDMSALSTTMQTVPDSGHVEMYADTYAGLENLMFQDSSGNIGRLARDNFFNGYNAETTTLQVGEAVYVSAGLSADQTHIVRRCDASNPATLPCDGIVVQVGNISTGAIGRVMRAGRTESTFNTSAYASGDKLYVPVKLNGLSIVTNVAPSGSNIVQLVGKVHVAGVAGRMTVWTSGEDKMSNVISNWVSSSDNTVNAATLGGSTLSEIEKQTIVYYVWGSSNGPIAGTKLASIYSSSLLPVWTNTATSVTNGQKIGAYSVPHNELTATLQRGPLEIYATLARTGDSATRGFMGIFTVLESNKTTVAVAYTNTTFVFPVTPVETSYNIDVAESIQLNGGLNRFVKLEFFATTGWGHGESIYSLSQDGYLTRFRFQSSAAGLYAVNSDLDAETARAIEAEGALSNRIESVNTNLSERINTETNRAYVAETNLSERINTETNRAYVAETNLQSQITLATNRISGLEGQTNLYMRTNALPALTNGFVTATITNGLASTGFVNSAISPVTNRVQVLETLTNAVQFLANIGTAGSQTFGAATAQVLFTNLVYNHGGAYSNAAARWTPGVSNVVVKISGSMSITTANQPAVYTARLYKNGALRSNMMITRSQSNIAIAQNFSYVDVTTNAADYYEVYFTSDKAAQTTAGSGADNWWGGQIVY